MNQENAGKAIYKCIGCGIKLQSEHEDRLGFVPESAIGKENVTCQRCFRIKHYNEISNTALDQDDFLRILNHIGTTDSLVVHIVDIFDFEGSIIEGLQRFIGSNPVLLVVNKADLLPRNLNLNKVDNWVRRQAKDYGLKLADVVIASAKKGTGFERVVEMLQKYRKSGDIYVVGATNAGKSTLINRLITDYSDLKRELTTSLYPGTTLDVVNIPLDDGSQIIDTPGIVYPYRLTEIAAKVDLPVIMPSVAIKPRIYQLNEAQTLFFGAMARFDFVKGERQSFTCYVSNRLTIHRTKLDKADELYEAHKGEMLTPPGFDQLEALPQWTRHSFKVSKGLDVDIAISGLGWIRVNSDQGAHLEVYAPSGVKVIMRHALI